MSDGNLEARILGAALVHVPFDGWSAAALEAAARDIGVDPGLVRALFPRGGLDLALAWHRQGDRAMVAALAARDLSGLRIRERVALAIRLRLESADKEAVRRAAALLSLPCNAPDGAAALWHTADAVWTALGDRSEDGNWYTKRAILSAVHSATVLYWLGDTSSGDAATWDFLDRRIDEVMRFEKAKAEARSNPVLGRVLAPAFAVLDRMRKPGAAAEDLPGHLGPGRAGN